MAAMYSYRRRELNIECESCGATDVIENVSNFREGMDQAKLQGWRAYMADFDWHHACPECAKSKEW